MGHELPSLSVAKGDRCDNFTVSLAVFPVWTVFALTVCDKCAHMPHVHTCLTT